MKQLLLLSGENLDLSREEALALSGCNEYSQEGKLLILDSKRFRHDRLAYTHKLSRLLFSCKEKYLQKNLESINWNREVKGSFYVKASGMKDKAADIAGIIWGKLKSPKVNAKKPETQIELIKGRRVHCGILLWENKENFNIRKAHMRPGFSPVSLHPKLARALVNLSRARKAVLDPFCGTGGILLEAGLMGLKAVGSDTDPGMLKLAEKNFKHFKIKGYKLIEKDAAKIKLKAEAIVTDPPYGQASSFKEKSLRSLLNKFLKNAYSLLREGGYLVIVLPNGIRIKSKFKAIKRIDFYIHKSLTRTINVMLKQEANNAR